MIYNFNFTGPGGLIINLASCAGLTHTKYHDSLAYWISKHAVVTITRNLGGPAIVRKTGIKVSTWCTRCSVSSCLMCYSMSPCAPGLQRLPSWTRQPRRWWWPRVQSSLSLLSGSARLLNWRQKSKGMRTGLWYSMTYNMYIFSQSLYLHTCSQVGRPDCCSAQHPPGLLPWHPPGNGADSLSLIQSSANIWLRNFYSSPAGACHHGNDDNHVIPYAYSVWISWHVN